MFSVNKFMFKVYSLKQSSEDLLWFWNSKTGQIPTYVAKKCATIPILKVRLCFVTKKRKTMSFHFVQITKIQKKN
jgi:hypothetical protein